MGLGVELMTVGDLVVQPVRILGHVGLVGVRLAPVCYRCGFAAPSPSVVSRQLRNSWPGARRVRSAVSSAAQ
jgi:hypothetical protein